MTEEFRNYATPVALSHSCVDPIPGSSHRAKLDPGFCMRCGRIEESSASRNPRSRWPLIILLFSSWHREQKGKQIKIKATIGAARGGERRNSGTSSLYLQRVTAILAEPCRPYISMLSRAYTKIEIRSFFGIKSPVTRMPPCLPESGSIRSKLGYLHLRTGQAGWLCCDTEIWKPAEQTQEYAWRGMVLYKETHRQFSR